jgi:glutamate/tyrosine decarboxylase-like PLP-dependent enzyme
LQTGAFDNLVELSSIARSENIWFHVDGAFGSLVILDPQRRHLVSGIEQADSLAFDFHKWLHCPHDAGCALIRDVNLHQSTFTMHNTFIHPNERGFLVGNLWFNNLGPELSRSFRALKVWFTFKEHGFIKLGEKIAENCEQAQYLVSLLEKHADLIRIVRPVTLNIVNFRFEPKILGEANVEMIDTFNNELVADMQLSGIAIPSTSYINKKLYIRVCIVSHRTTLEDFHIFLDSLLHMYRIRIQACSDKNT